MSDNLSQDDIVKLIDIFKNNPSKTEENKTIWFRKILKELKIFGHNKFDQTFKQTGNNYSKSKIYKDFVSISSFSVLDYYGLYQTVFVTLYSDILDWSHPGVLKIQKLVISSKKERFSFENKDTWLDIKLFSNIVYSFVNNININEFQIRNFDYNVFRNFALNHIENSFDKDKIVVIDAGRVLLNIPYKDIVFRNNRFNFLSYENSGIKDEFRTYSRLNHICRKNKIDILP